MAVSTTAEKTLSPRIEQFLALLVEALRQGNEMAPKVGKTSQRPPRAVAAD